jgi:hypothetical protein
LQLANDSDFQSARKGLAPSGKITPRKLVFVVEICIFELFEKLSGCVLHMQGTHKALPKAGLKEFYSTFLLYLNFGIFIEVRC